MSQPGKFVYDWPRAALVADSIVVTKEEHPRTLLIKRKNEPWAGLWALPGGFVEINETLAQAAVRELREETSLCVDVADMKQVGAWGDPGRDPRGWVVGIAYVCSIEPTISDCTVKAGDDAADARWYPIDDIPFPLACDHREMLKASFHMLSQECCDDAQRKRFLQAAHKV